MSVTIRSVVYTNVIHTIVSHKCKHPPRLKEFSDDQWRLLKSQCSFVKHNTNELHQVGMSGLCQHFHFCLNTINIVLAEKMLVTVTTVQAAVLFGLCLSTPGPLAPAAEVAMSCTSCSECFWMLCFSSCSCWSKFGVPLSCTSFEGLKSVVATIIFSFEQENGWTCCHNLQFMFSVSCKEER